MNPELKNPSIVGRVTIFLAILALVGTLAWNQASAAASVSVLPDPAVDAPRAANADQTAVISGGCFWGIQAVFQHVKGVKSATSGYSGGPAAAAEYEQVSTGTLRAGMAATVDSTARMRARAATVPVPARPRP